MDSFTLNIAKYSQKIETLIQKLIKMTFIFVL